MAALGITVVVAAIALLLIGLGPLREPIAAAAARRRHLGSAHRRAVICAAYNRRRFRSEPSELPV